VERQISLSDIGEQPMNLSCGQPQPVLRYRKSRLRDIKYGDVLVALLEKVIDQRRFSSADVNNAG